jgi:hypothetical protein
MDASYKKTQLLASFKFNNHEEACNMLCGKKKARFEPRTLGTKAERYDHCATRPVDATYQFKGRLLDGHNRRDDVSRRLRPRTAKISIRYHQPFN